ncbi:hypothetical protein GJ496_004542 [Pomphorhynchus laevis]|nr:hypothetical protein GJ496_004542 [Pomphorhynchus laevis]
MSLTASPLLQYVVVRNDLNWPVGSLIAQGIHASIAAVHKYRDHSDTMQYLNSDEMTTVVLAIDSEASIRSLIDTLSRNHVDHVCWIENPENVLSSLATRPLRKNSVKHLFQHLKLFN